MTVVSPGSTEEVADILRDAAAGGLTVVPTGAGTKLTWGLPVEPDLYVDLSGMDKVLDHQAGDLIVEVQAGVPLTALQQAVAGAGQRLLVDETVPGATIGGTIATNASGPRRLTAGTTRDLLIGLTVVRADGVVAKSGGRVVKNVAGYDLGKLMVGSFGTLAVATEAVFRLHPVPEARRWARVGVETAARAHELTHAVVHSQLVPAAVEVEWPAAGSGELVVEIVGRTAGVERRMAGLVAILAGAAVDDVEPPTWTSYPWRSGQTGLKLTCVLSGLCDVLTVAREVGAHVRGSSGAGVLYAALPDADAVPGAVARLREVCARHEGTVVVVDAPPEVKQAVDVWGPVPALDLMRRVKDQFDPDHRLSPGRFVGGI